MFEWMFGGRVKTVERKLKTLHARQSRLREKIAQAQAAGDAEKVKALLAQREAVNREVADLTAEHKRLKAEA